MLTITKSIRKSHKRLINILCFLACRQDVTVKTSRVQELEKAVTEHQRELQHRQNQSKEYEQKLSQLQEKTTVESERGVELDKALQECQQEMKAHIERLAEVKEQHEYELNSKIAEV